MGTSGIWSRARSEEDAKLLQQEHALRNQRRPHWSPLQKRILLAATVLVFVAAVISAVLG